MFRIGQGYDCHRFCAGSFITLGGVKIDFTQGIDAHSDGDVLLHAMVDAMLGAAGLGDIGQHFPDTDPQFKNKDSVYFLEHTHELLQQKNCRIINMDNTIITEAPKLKPHMSAMREKIASALSLSEEVINIKATTQEKMGWIGRMEGLAALSVVLLQAKC